MTSLQQIIAKKNLQKNKMDDSSNVAIKIDHKSYGIVKIQNKKDRI